MTHTKQNRKDASECAINVRHLENVALYFQAVANLNLPPGLFYAQVMGLREAFLGGLAELLEANGGLEPFSRNLRDIPNLTDTK